MQDTMLLDRRTKDLVKEYVPEGDVLDSIVCFFSIFASREHLHSMPAKISSDMPSRISRFSGQSISYILYSLSAFIASVLIMNFTLETVSSAFPPKDSYSHPASIMAWIRSTSSFTSPL